MPTVVPPTPNRPPPTDATGRVVSFAVELTGLLRSMPCLFAPAGERADWYDRKAALLDQVVAESPTCDRVEVAGLAPAARLRAAALRQGWS